MTEQQTPVDRAIQHLLGWDARNQGVLLLQALEQTGSINKAAQAVGIQYKRAWQKLDQLGNLLPWPLLEKQAGGSGGGGTTLTSEGKDFLCMCDAMQREFSRFLEFLQEEPERAVATMKILRRLEMKISARNIWLGTVDHIDNGAVNSVVTVALKGEDKVCSVITLQSVNRLELAPGREVMAVVKASNVLIGEDIPADKISARNILTGKIREIIPGVVNDEVTIELAGGNTVTSVITSASVRRLDLKEGKRISALIKATDVLLATA
ncbi:MAG: ModE family transcriptional regulator [Deltaproteobacteria bacterium]|nr:MAG: ModE family transcriptional regulator [Deltaproteobacteria bacterium]